MFSNLDDLFTRMVWAVSDQSNPEDVCFPDPDLLDELGLFDTRDRTRLERLLQAMVHDFMLVLATVRITHWQLRVNYQRAQLLGADLLLESLSSKRVTP